MRGVIYVAYGEPAQTCLQRSLQSLRVLEPEVEVLVLGDQRVANVEYSIVERSQDVGARSIKTQLQRWVPKHWTKALYLDVDTVVLQSLHRFWDPLDKGWDMVICRDETAAAVNHCRIRYPAEMRWTVKSLGLAQIVQYAGGVISWRPNKETTAFWKTWYIEWKRFGRRDQGALTRALDQLPRLKWWSLEYGANAKHKAEAREIWHVHGMARRRGTP